MFDSNDIYSHLLNGGDKQILYDALAQEIAKAETKVRTTLELEKKDKERREKKNKAADAALKALVDYCKAAGVEYSKEELASLIKLLGEGNIRFGKNMYFFDRWSL